MIKSLNIHKLEFHKAINIKILSHLHIYIFTDSILTKIYMKIRWIFILCNVRNLCFFFEYLMLEKQEIIWGGEFKTVDLNAKFKQIQISPPPNLVLFFYLF